MVENVTTALPRAVALIDAGTSPATSTLKILGQTIRDCRKAKTHKSDDYVARVNDVVDRAYTLSTTTRAEAAAMLTLILESDGEGLDPVVRRALGNVLAFLKLDS